MPRKKKGVDQPIYQLAKEVLPDLPQCLTVAELAAAFAVKYPHHPQVRGKDPESLRQYISTEIHKENKRRQALRQLVEVLVGKEYGLPWGRYARAGEKAHMEHLLEQHNHRVREELLKRLQKLDWLHFQNEVIPRILEHCGFSEFMLGHTGPDEGIDGEATFKWFLMEGRAILQAKRYKDTARVGVAEIDKLIGVAAGKKFDMAILVTTGRFTPKAIEKAKRNQSGKLLILIDGQRLVEIMTELGIGIRQENIEFKRYQVDETFLKDLQELAD
jgi:restriction endonuclease Mrr